MKVNWCRSCGGGANFGDQLSQHLLRHYGYDVEWAPPGTADLFMVGSILSKVPRGFRGTIFGTGFIRYGMHGNFKRARVLAVRGVGSREAGGLPKGIVLGDPGVLAPDLVPDVLSGREGGLGPVLLPHYVDLDMAQRHPGLPVLDITAEPQVLIEAVARASIVYTSTLHGLILADALGVHQVLEPHHGVIGGMWKFEDYASAFGDHIVPGEPRLTPRDKMQERQATFRGLLREIA